MARVKKDTDGMEEAFQGEEIKMAKVSVHLGFTFRVGPLETNQYSRIDVSIDQIDTELPIEQQLEDAGQTVDTVWKHVKAKVDSGIDEVLDDSGK